MGKNIASGKTHISKQQKGTRWYSCHPKSKEKDIIQTLVNQYKNISPDNIRCFEDFPLSPKTQKGLASYGYKEPTEIQRESIGLSLRGSDILGAAKTGSGKTLAFVIPILEVLFCKQWSEVDGLGALIITPTRELAYQIFATLCKVGKFHDFSAGLVIGGKDLKFERQRMDTCNIIICTPGRLLHHMDENPLFNCDNMQILVLDEADRCLDMGFEKTMNAIIENLPQERQTLLFSATQTKSVKDLARLSLKDPMYVSVHEHSKHSTPESLQQNYIVCELYEKLGVLWSFIRNHLNQKILVFMSSCKQVKFHYELFCKLRPGISLLALYGSLHQLRRMKIYDIFCRQSHVVLFATDIAARGLDFPAVNWVVQFDCPEDANTYIHRAGRTARYQRGGESLLILLPSEENGMIGLLQEKKIPINKIKINPSKMTCPEKKIETLLVRDVALKESAQRAFVSYLKSVFLMKNKQIFNIQSLPTDIYSRSLGLIVPPRIRFLKNSGANKVISLAEDADSLPLPSHSVPQEYDEFENVDKKKGREIYNFDIGESGDDDDDDLFQVKRKDHDLEGDENEILEPIPSRQKKVITKAKIAKKILKKNIIPNKKILFSEDGVEINTGKERISELAKEYDQEDEGGIDIEKAKKVLQEEDRFDKQYFKEKNKLQHKKKKLKERKKRGIERDEDEDEEKDEEERVESESDNSGPDLSWLPDPDQIYGPDEDANEVEGDDNKISSESEKSSESSEEEIHRPLPLKRKKGHSWVPEKKQNVGSKIESRELAFSDEEELALQLLQNKR